MPKSPTDWMKLLLSTGEYADVHFLHASDVFEAMFRFDSKNANSENDSANCPVVEVSDVEAAAFKVMLSFIYAGDLSGLNGDNAMAVLYAARLFDLEDFANCCLSYIDKNADTLLKSDEFLQIDQKMLSEILERDELQIRGEISIWNANRRAVLGPALFKIRFPLLTKKEFLKIVPSKVLTAEEKFGVYQFFCQPHFNPVKFPSHWRNWTFGTISMDIEKVSEFAREPMESYRYSDNTRTEGTDTEKYLGIFLLCDALKQEDKNFSCKCSATLRIVSKMNASANCPVEVPDVEAAAFKVMLSFIYTEELSELNGDNAMAVLYAAKKYNIPGLFNPCLDVPVSELLNVFLAYAQACLFDLKDFAHDCLMFIDKNVETLIKSEEFLQIDQKLLCQILERDELQIPENRRQMLGPALLKIRFPLFSKEEFLKKIVPSQVLTAEEKIGVYQFHCQPIFRGNYSHLFCPLKFPSHWRIWTFGTISMNIEEMSEFAREPTKSYRYSDNTVYIKGLSWKIMAEINERTEGTDNEKYLCIFFCCDGPREENENWSCKCSATLRIVSKMNGVENSVGKFYDLVFNNNLYGIGDHFIPFVELMEPSKGFYDQNGDKITVSIDFAVGEPKADKSISNSSKSHGTLFMDIEKVSEFAREIIRSQRKSASVTYINGLPWKILAKISQRTESNDNNEKWLSIYLLCAAPQEDINWSCKCLAIVRIVSQKCGVADIKEEFNEETTFNSESVTRGYSDFISFAELMDPLNGVYDKGEDKVTLAIYVTVKEAKTEHK
ncbi:hypothetical protein niasHS_000823 [Heterodera schachtii]|uniref:Uncharacterized protein n=1 Tax=Heterodera schachtii TaxID=97005 RepID=A0ABD2K735_HETSC